MVCLQIFNSFILFVKTLTEYSLQTDNESLSTNNTNHPASRSSPLENSSIIDVDETNRRSLQIKQEHLEHSSSNEEECSRQNPLKRSRTDVADAESNTIHSGK